MRDHRKLEAFQLADRLALAVYELTSEFPPSERYGLQSQLRRAAVSVPTNIVEGCARDSQGDYLRFLDIAFGSSRELICLLSLATRLKYVNMNQGHGAVVVDLADHTAGLLVNLKRSLST